MTDREKVVTGLELCTNISPDGCLMLCPYKDEKNETYEGFCEQALKLDALALLNEDCHNCKLECLLQKYDELKEKYDALLKEQKIVRCKDCKKQGSYDCHITSLTGQTSSDDWFCADGQPR